MSALAGKLAEHRFGLGARADRPLEAADARRALLDEVAATAPPGALAGLLSGPELLERLMDFRGERRAARQAAAAVPGASPAPSTAPAAPAAPAPAPTPPPAASSAPTPAAPAASQPAAGQPPNPVPVFYQEEVHARLRAAFEAPIGFKERLVLFWSNHFTVAAVNPRVRIVAGAFEREAIRPHVAGRFEDMLQAATRHPAMLIYLDNARSFGPNSQAGLNRKRGLNENLAREILELHTLGVDGGYTQGDVTRLAEILTGWSLVNAEGVGGAPGSFIFRPAMHEPGARAVLGRTYAQAGIEQGRAVLFDLAHHPATARHLARKLCRHFIADEPPAAAVTRVADALIGSKGALMAAYEALLSSPEAWEPRQAKLRTPYEYVVALARALGSAPEPGPALRALTLMGQPTYVAPSPKGWPEEAAAWAAPDAFKTRIDVAELWARRSARPRPLEVAEAVLGPLLSDETRTAMRRAETTQQALTLMAMSPEFQRR